MGLNILPLFYLMLYRVVKQISKDRRDYGPDEMVDLSEDEAVIYGDCLTPVVREAVNQAARNSRKAMKRGGPNVDVDRGARD